MALPPEIDALLRDAFAETYPTGSRFICDPAPLTTDEDFLVVLHKVDEVQPLCRKLENLGFEWDFGEGYEERDDEHQFWSFRRDDLNLLITADADFARRHKLATAVCKSLNLLDKAHRVTVFQAILYDRLHRDVKITLPDLTEVAF